jgi:hypothetical protein
VGFEKGAKTGVSPTFIFSAHRKSFTAKIELQRSKKSSAPITWWLVMDLEALLEAL